MAFSYLYNKQVYPADLFTLVNDGLGITPLYIDYDIKTFDIAIWFESALTVPQQSALDSIVANIVYVDKSGYAAFSFITATEENAGSLTANTIESSYTYATYLSGGTIYSGGTNLYDIFLTSSDGNDITRVQPGTNITTGGTDNFPTVSLVASPSVNNITFSGAATGGNVFATQLSGGTIYSGSTNLYDIFSTGTGDTTRIQPGSNITTGGTDNFPIVNLTASPSVNNITFSGAAIGGTVQAGSGSFTSLSGGTLSGGIIYSGGTNLYDIFLGINDDYVKNIVTVGQGGLVDFSSIKDAVDSITAATTSNPYVVSVGPGMYIEDTITMKPGISVVANSLGSVLVIPSVSTNTIVVGADGSSIVNLILTNASGAGGKAVYHNGTGGTGFLIKDCNFNGNETQVHCYGTSATSIVYIDRCSVTGNNTYGFRVDNTGTTTSQIIFTNGTYKDTSLPVTTDFFTVMGTGSTCTITNSTFRVAQSTGSTFLKAEDGANVRIIGSSIRGFENTIQCLSGGGACNLIFDSVGISESTNDIFIENPGTTGYFNGVADFSKISIAEDSPFFITKTDPQIITVASKGEDFTSIADAVNFITNASDNNRFLIKVGAGTFVEPLIDLSTKPYISIVGSSIQTTLIIPDGNHHVISMGSYNEISFLSISGATTGYAGIAALDSGDFSQAHKISMQDCDTGILITSSSQPTYFYGEYIDLNGVYSCGVRVEASNGIEAFANLENYYNLPSVTGVTGTYVSGSGATADILASGNLGAGDGTAFYIEDGANITINSTYVDSWSKGLHIGNIGLASTFTAPSISLYNNATYDLQVEHISASGTISGNLTQTKINNASANVSWSFLDPSDGTYEITNRLYMTFPNSTHTDLSTIIVEGSTMGLIEGGVLTSGTGFTVNVSAGFGYLEQFPYNAVLQRVDWNSTFINLSANTENFIYFNQNETLIASPSNPDTKYNILLGRVVTNSTSIEFISQSPLSARHTSNKYSDLFREALGPIYSSGSITSEGITPFTIDVTSGKFYYSTNVFNPVGGTGLTFNTVYRDGLGSHVISATTIVPSGYYDNGSGTLAATTASAYTKHALYLIGDGAYEKYYLVYGQNEYSSLLEVENAGLPLPPSYFTNALTIIATIITQQGASGITEIFDNRPIVGFRSQGVSTAASTHGELLGLDADDHQQYLLVDGSRAMSGNFNVGLNHIISAGTINNVTIQAHASRHLPNGADPLATGIPVSINSQNTEGNANSFSRSNHTHAHGVHSGGTSHSVVDSIENGFMSSTDKIYFDTISGQFNTKANLSGATFTGTVQATTLSGGTIFSGGTNLYDIFSTGTGDITRVQSGTNITTGGTDNFPTVSLVASPSVNNITFSGAAIGGNVQADAGRFTSLSATTLSGGTILSGGTNLYDIFSTGGPGGTSTYVQPGTNIITGGTANNPIVSVVSSPSFNNLTISGLTSSSGGAIFANLSGTSIFSGSTNLQSIFNLFSAADTTKANLSGATFTGQVNIPTLSATTLSATTSVFTSSFRFPVSPVAGFILTSDASGNATWQPSPTSGSGTTKLDIQSVSTATTTTATAALVDVPGMVLAARNLGSSATTYIINFAGTFSNNNNAGNSTIRATLNGVQIPGSPVMTFTNAGASMATAQRNIALVCVATGVKNGDVIKIQMSASTGTLTAQAGKSLSIIGTLNANIV